MLLQYSTTAPIYPRPVELSLLIFLQSKGIWIAVGKAFTNVSDEETKRLELLVDLAYTCATEAIAFVKFGALCEAQKRAGVGLGEQYLNIHAAKGFTKEFTGPVDVSRVVWPYTDNQKNMLYRATLFDNCSLCCHCNVSAGWSAKSSIFCRYYVVVYVLGNFQLNLRILYNTTYRQNYETFSAL